MTSRDERTNTDEASVVPERRRRPAAHLRERLDRATADLDPPLAAVDLGAFRANAAELVSRAGGKPIRVASKSVRCRQLLRDVLALPGFRGLMAYTLPEALWLAADGVSDDVLVAYPTVHRAGLRALAADERLASVVTLMIDDAAQLDAVDAVVGRSRPDLRVCLELDASWQAFGGRVRLGTLRSPVRRPAELGQLARVVHGRPGFRLVGLMAYEGQIAGVGDAPPGRRAYGAAIRAVQRRSAAELAERRALAVAAVRAVVRLEFVNGGGTGSLERTAAEAAVTEVAAGSGLYGPALFDAYRSFQPRPAAGFALPVVRRPGRGVATVLGGGYIASGPPGRDRLPTPWLPEGLRFDRFEAAGEVQTPLLGAAADQLHIGDRVWFRHAKAGELAEHFAVLQLVLGDRRVGAAPTYRGEGRAFL
jgi:D-serine deaminase-like pyridoxal phosphate-dependent protein